MRLGSCGLACLSLCVSGAMAEQVVLTPLSNGRLERTATGQPYTMTSPPANGRLLMQRLSSTGLLREGYLEYSLASLPSDATVTSASFTYTVDLITYPPDPSLSLNLYDGGDGATTLADISKNTWNVAQSQDYTSVGVYTTNFFSVIPLNDRAENFPSGYLGLSLFPRIDGKQTGITSKEYAALLGEQAPVLTITYSVPEPGSLAVVALTVLAPGLMLRRRMR